MIDFDLLEAKLAKPVGDVLRAVSLAKGGRRYSADGERFLNKRFPEADIHLDQIKQTLPTTVYCTVANLI
ncbi:hypothetical protein [Bradyrhizobium canariense]|uniref:hypothetical protein n=1 Tax=Bradyrhizobium canariense TaxID=255045 RepID=UPI00142FC6D8|nr:hypothetical protein [Bradyrhizobium canariense]